MSFIYCKTCDWEQDDFWTFRFKLQWRFWRFRSVLGYNPIGCFLEDMVDNLSPRWIHFDDTFVKDLIRFKYKPIIRMSIKHYEPDPNLSSGPNDKPRDYVITEVHSWWLIYHSWKRNWRKYNNMRWQTFKKWKSDPNRHKCPRCGEGLTED